METCIANLREQGRLFREDEAARDELAARLGITRAALDAFLVGSAKHPGIRWSL